MDSWHTVSRAWEGSTVIFIWYEVRTKRGLLYYCNEFLFMWEYLKKRRCPNHGKTTLRSLWHQLEAKVVWDKGDQRVYPTAAICRDLVHIKLG